MCSDRARVRIIPKVLPLLDRKPLVENECTFLEVTIGEFCNWLGDDQHKDAGKLTGISRDKFSIYMDYVYFGNLFKEYPNAVTEVCEKALSASRSLACSLSLSLSLRKRERKKGWRIARSVSFHVC